MNNAGIGFIDPAENVSAVEFRRVLENYLVAPFLLAKAFGAMMLAQQSASIINVASVAGLVDIADRAAYKLSKHGLVGLTRTLHPALVEQPKNLQTLLPTRGAVEGALRRSNRRMAPHLDVVVGFC